MVKTLISFVIVLFCLLIPTMSMTDDVGNGSIINVGSAPALSILDVYGAYSANHPAMEVFRPYAMISDIDHGGAYLVIVTHEIGYGFMPVAKMGGYTLKQFQSQAIVDSSRTVLGYYRWWDASGFQGGYFTYQNTSVNGGNTMFTSIIIR